MLAIANLPRTYWEEVVSTVCYIFNRTYSRSIKTTPFSLWFGKNPNYENLRIFGCPSYALVPLDTRSKLDNHAIRTKFVGYGEPHGYKGYRLYDPKSKRFLFSRRVIFDEDKLISNPHPHCGDEKIQDATTMSNIESNKEVIVSPTNSWRAPPTSSEIQQVTTDHIPINPLPLMSSPLEARPQVSHFNR